MSTFFFSLFFSLLIAGFGSGPYASLHAGKYSTDDNWRLQAFDSSIKPAGDWKPITPLENVSS